MQKKEILPYEQLIELGQEIPELGCAGRVGMMIGGSIEQYFEILNEDIISVQRVSAPHGGAGLLIDISYEQGKQTRVLVEAEEIHFEPDTLSISLSEILGRETSNNEAKYVVKDMPEVLPFTHIEKFVISAEEVFQKKRFDLDQAIARLYVCKAIFAGLKRLGLYPEHNHEIRVEKLIHELWQK